MMVLNKRSLKDNERQWTEKGYTLPKFDLEAVAAKTERNPIWLHIGAGNIFRCFPALLQQKLLDAGLSDTGIVVCDLFDTEIIDKAYSPFDNLNITVSSKADGTLAKTVVASITKTLKDGEKEELERVFVNPGLQIVSFTITEKGYSAANGTIITAAQMLHKRFCENAAPLTLLSLDNCSHNGEKLRAAILEYIQPFIDRGVVQKGFIAYLREKVSFPISMIDKITPRPSEQIASLLAKDGIDAQIHVTSKNTYVSLFVNTEVTEYLVIEDNFGNGRPPLERAGVIFTDAETVDMVEKMKVCTCLNPLHTVLAVFGCLLGYKTIWEAMEDEALVRLVKKIGYDEGLPVVTDPGIIHPKEFIDTVLNERFPNKLVPDTPQRIVCDTSLKIPVRFGETLKLYAERKMDVKSLEYIPVFFAGWLRYLLGTDDKGDPFEPSPDPRLEELRETVKADDLAVILSDKSIFGIDLVEYGLYDKVTGYYRRMNGGKGAVRTVLKGEGHD